MDWHSAGFLALAHPYRQPTGFAAQFQVSIIQASDLRDPQTGGSQQLQDGPITQVVFPRLAENTAHIFIGQSFGGISQAARDGVPSAKSVAKGCVTILTGSVSTTLSFCRSTERLIIRESFYGDFSRILGSKSFFIYETVSRSRLFKGKVCEGWPLQVTVI